MVVVGGGFVLDKPDYLSLLRKDFFGSPWMPLIESKVPFFLEFRLRIYSHWGRMEASQMLILKLFNELSF